MITEDKNTNEDSLDKKQAAPASEEAAPTSEEAAPTAEEAAPASEEAAPASEEAAPASEEAAPTAEEAAPASEEDPLNYDCVSIFGQKVGMSRLFLDDGDSDCPVTVVSAGPCYVTQLKTIEKEGYNAVQISYKEVKKANVTKPLAGHFKKSGSPVNSMLKEFRVEDLNDFNIGDEINVSAFEVGDKVRVLGKSIGRGFAGHMKRHGFGGGRASHGKNSVMRKGGSIGAGSDPSRVWKGTRMAGRMGGDNVTVKNLSIVKIDKEKNLLYINGSVPGANKGLVFISKR